MRRALVLDPQASPLPARDRWPGLDDVEVADLYDIGQLDLQSFGALFVAGMVDQEHLWHQRDVIASFLSLGRTVVFCGQLFRRWLPGCEPFTPAPIQTFADYTVHLAEPHPIFAGVDPADLTYRRGVAGFFARGHHPPPRGASVLATLNEGQPITWVDQRSTDGTVVVHAGADLLGYGPGDGTAARLVPQLLAWARREGNQP